MKKIAWEKWYDVDPNESVNIASLTQDILNSEDEFSEKEESDGVNIENFMFIKRISTPVGAFDPNDNMLPTKMFDCWIGHTNFAITDKELSVLDNVEGIEVLEVMTKYRFFIGIGKLFNFQSVRLNIQHALCGNESNELEMTGDITGTSAIFQKINEIMMNVQGRDRWAVYVGKDGSIRSISSDEYPEKEDYYRELQVLRSNKNGNIITFEDI